MQLIRNHGQTCCSGSTRRIHRIDVSGSPAPVRAAASASVKGGNVRRCPSSTINRGSIAGKGCTLQSRHAVHSTGGSGMLYDSVYTGVCTICHQPADSVMEGAKFERHLSFRSAFYYSKHRFLHVPLRVTHPTSTFAGFPLVTRLGVRVHIGVDRGRPALCG